MRLATSFVFRCRCPLVVLILMATIRPAMGQANVTGKWTTLSYTMPINPVHAALCQWQDTDRLRFRKLPADDERLPVGPAVWSSE